VQLRPLLLVLVLVLGLSACGGGDDEAGDDAATTTQTEPGTTGDAGGGDAEAGSQVFAQAGCGGCHVLAAAGSNGTVGPSLDESAPDEALVIERVTNGMGAMPSFRDELSEQEIRDVAAYVSESTG